MLRERWKMSRVPGVVISIIQVLIGVMIVYSAIAGFRYVFRHSNMVSPYANYAWNVLQASRDWLLCKSHEEGTSLPTALPEKASGYMLTPDGPFNGPLVLLDPFSRGPAQLQFIAAHRDSWFKVSGDPIKMRRINDRLALLYSIGPDRDDDLSKISLPVHELQQLKKALIATTYDPTNGLRSAGDMIVIVDGNSLPSRPCK